MLPEMNCPPWCHRPRNSRRSRRSARPLSRVMADFGQSDFGQQSLASPFWRPTLAKPTSTCVCVCLCVFVCVCVCVFVSVCVCLCGVGVGFTVSVWGFQGFGLVMFGAPGTALPRTALPRTALPGTALPGTALPLDALPLDRPKFRSFFSLSRRKIRSFLPSLGVFSLNFGGVLKTGTLKCARLGSPNVHIGAPRRFKHHQNSTRRPPEREEKNKFCGWTGKNSAKFRANHPSGPHFFCVWAPHPSNPHPSNPHLSTHPRQLKTHKKP